MRSPKQVLLQLSASNLLLEEFDLAAHRESVTVRWLFALGYALLSFLSEIAPFKIYFKLVILERGQPLISHRES